MVTGKWISWWVKKMVPSISPWPRGKDLFAAEVEHFGTGSRIASLALGNVLGDGGQEILALVGGRRDQGRSRFSTPKGRSILQYLDQWCHQPEFCSAAP